MLQYLRTRPGRSSFSLCFDGDCHDASTVGQNGGVCAGFLAGVTNAKKRDYGDAKGEKVGSCGGPCEARARLLVCSEQVSVNILSSSKVMRECRGNSATRASTESSPRRSGSHIIIALTMNCRISPLESFCFSLGMARIAAYYLNSDSSDTLDEGRRSPRDLRNCSVVAPALHKTSQATLKMSKHAGTSIHQLVSVQFLDPSRTRAGVMH